MAWIVEICFLLVGSSSLSCSFQDRDPCDRGLYCDPGSRVADPNNCQNYFLCHGGSQWAIVKCDYGKQYDINSSQCVLEGSGTCADTCPPNLGPVIKENVLVVCNNDDPCGREQFCDPGCTIADPDDCQGYFVCHAGAQWLRTTCANGTEYDTNSNDCVQAGNGACAATCPPYTGPPTTPTEPPDPAPCPEAPDNCTEGERYPDHYFCDEHYLCNHGQLILQKCSPGLFFDIVSQECKPFSEVDCSYRCLTTSAPTTTAALLTTTQPYETSQVPSETSVLPPVTSVVTTMTSVAPPVTSEAPPGGSTTADDVTTQQESTETPDDPPPGLEPWAVAVIVVASVLSLGFLIFFLLFCCVCKRDNGSKVAPSEDTEQGKGSTDIIKRPPSVDMTQNNVQKLNGGHFEKIGGVWITRSALDTPPQGVVDDSLGGLPGVAMTTSSLPPKATALPPIEMPDGRRPLPPLLEPINEEKKRRKKKKKKRRKENIEGVEMNGSVNMHHETDETPLFGRE